MILAPSVFNTIGWNMYAAGRLQYYYQYYYYYYYTADNVTYIIFHVVKNHKCISKLYHNDANYYYYYITF